MKKLLLPIFLIGMFLLSACASPAVQGFVQLPDAERLAIITVVVGLLGLVFTRVGELFPWTSPFIAKYKMEISLTLAAAVVGWIESVLPSAYPEISILVVQLFLAVFAAIGLFKLLDKAGVPGFRA